MPRIYSSDGSTLIEYVEGEPVCGRDFCDNCGDCIYCYGDDCNSGEWCGGWSWVLYEGSDDDLIAELRAAQSARANGEAERRLIAASEHMRSDDEVMERARANGAASEVDQ